MLSLDHLHKGSSVRRSRVGAPKDKDTPFPPSVSHPHPLSDSPLSKAAKGRGRGAIDEDDEDAQLLADEDEGGERAGHRLQARGLGMSGGNMPVYRFNWSS